jgi:membrane fusion protein (multidrug efflux system)
MSAGPEPVPASPPARSRRRIVLSALAVVAVIAIALGLWQWWFARGHVTSDNAQIEGHIIPILTRVGGYVGSVTVEDDQAVRAGQVLVTIDDRDLRARLEQAEADLANAIAVSGDGHDPGQATAQLAAARAAVEQTEAANRRAQGDLERYRTLAPRGIVSRQQLDAAETSAAAAAAALQAARDQVRAAGAAVRGAASRTQAARASREQAALMLSYAVIRAPVSGVVSRKSVEVGQLVQAGQPLMAVVPLHDVWVVTNLKETEVANVTPGDTVTISVDAYPGRRFHGRVESLSPATGARFSLLPPDNATGNFTKVVQRIPVRIQVESGADSLHPLRPGMSVKVVIDTRSGPAPRTGAGKGG